MRSLLLAGLLILPLASCKLLEDPESRDLKLRFGEWREELRLVSAALEQPGLWDDTTEAALRASSERLRSMAKSISDRHWSAARANRCQEFSACTRRQAVLLDALATAIQRHDGENVRDLTPRLRQVEDEARASFEEIFRPTRGP